jgi:hypothetical protein
MEHAAIAACPPNSATIGNNVCTLCNDLNYRHRSSLKELSYFNSIDILGKTIETIIGGKLRRAVTHLDY